MEKAEKAPESSSGRHFVSLSHTTIHFHFVHFIIPHQRQISLTHNAHHLYALPLLPVTPALSRCLSHISIPNVWKAPESSSGRHFMSFSHTTSHSHFVHFIIPHQRQISHVHNAYSHYTLFLLYVTPASEPVPLSHFHPQR